MLYDFDGPRLFTTADPSEGLWLVYWSDTESGVDRYVVVATTPAIVESLRNGATTVFHALNQPQCWLYDVGADLMVLRRWSVQFGDIPADAIPQKDITLPAPHRHSPLR